MIRKLEAKPNVKLLLVGISGAFSHRSFKELERRLTHEYRDQFETDDWHFANIDLGFWAASFCWIPWARNIVMKYVASRLSTLRLKYPRAKFILLGHSYGTYVLKTLVKFPIGIDRIITFGSVLPRGFDWTPLIENKEVGEIYNFVGKRDYVVKFLVAPLGLLVGFGMAGVCGFDDLASGRVRNIIKKSWGHSGYMKALKNGEIDDVIFQ